MSSLDAPVADLLDHYLPEYRQDRQDLPLWTFDEKAWDELDESWFEQIAWSPDSIAQRYLGRAGGLAEYLHHLESRGPGSPRYVATFNRWPHASIVLERPAKDEREQESVRLPMVLQAQVAALYACLESPIPRQAESLELPERPGRIDLTGALHALRKVFDELYEAIEEALLSTQPGPNGQPVSLLERVREEYGRRTTRDEWVKEQFEEARDALPKDEPRTAAELWYLRQDLDPRDFVSEAFKRADIPPRIRGNRKTILSLKAIWQAYNEALTLVDRYSSWEPSDAQLKALAHAFTADDRWTLDGETRSALQLYKERRNRRESNGRPDFVRILKRLARWLRFPYLSHPEPGPLRKYGSRHPKKAARGLLLLRLPAAVTDDNLRTNYLHEARQQYGDSP